MKIYKVTINNDPGGWKSGRDDSILVLANSPEEAIEIVKSEKWGEGHNFGEKTESYGYIDKFEENTYPHVLFISKSVDNTYNEQFNAVEVIFNGFEIDITTLREKKLKRILK